MDDAGAAVATVGAVAAGRATGEALTVDDALTPEPTAGDAGATEADDGEAAVTGAEALEPADDTGALDEVAPPVTAGAGVDSPEQAPVSATATTDADTAIPRATRPATIRRKN